MIKNFSWWWIKIWTCKCPPQFISLPTRFKRGESTSKILRIKIAYLLRVGHIYTSGLTNTTRKSRHHDTTIKIKDEGILWKTTNLTRINTQIWKDKMDLVSWFKKEIHVIQTQETTQTRRILKEKNRTKKLCWGIGGGPRVTLSWRWRRWDNSRRVGRTCERDETTRATGLCSANGRAFSLSTKQTHAKQGEWTQAQLLLATQRANAKFHSWLRLYRPDFVGALTQRPLPCGRASSR